VLAPERVVTNAHVVAAVRDPQVRIGGEGRRYAARVVVFDPVRDLAILDVPHLPAPPLPLGHDLSRGDRAVVAGFPLDGPYRLDSARVREVITARGEDIYGKRPSVRRVYSLYATVQPGNSGGPLLSADGHVVGIIFAKSLDDDSTGYALTLQESEPVLAKGRAATDPVPVGACAAG
jgi:S1-C subfamily serine protease